MPIEIGDEISSWIAAHEKKAIDQSEADWKTLMERDLPVDNTKSEYYIIKLVDYCLTEMNDNDIQRLLRDIDNNDEGKYVDVCSYLFIRDEISFVDIDNYPVEDDDFSDLRSAAWGYDLNLPVPFKPGDVLQINGFPFGPKVNIVILEVGDNLDCCCLQALSKNDDGLCTSLRLKSHLHLFAASRT